MVFGISAMILVGASWTLSGYAMGKAPQKNVDVSVLLFYSMGIAALISLFIGMLYGMPSAAPMVLAIIFGSLILGGIANYWQLDLMAIAMQKGHNGIVWSIIQSGFIFPFFMGIMFFGVPFTWVRMVAFAAAVISIILFGVAQGGKSSGKWLLPTFGAFLATGISQCLVNLPSYLEGSEGVSSIWSTCGLCAGFVFGALSRNICAPRKFAAMLRSQVHNVSLWTLTAVFLFMDIIVNYFLLFPGMDALAKAGAGAVAYPIMVCVCLLVFDLFSLMVLKEKHRPVQWVALILCFIGVVGLSIDWTEPEVLNTIKKLFL